MTPTAEELREACVAYARASAAAAPPLSTEQKDRLAVLLRPRVKRAAA